VSPKRLLLLALLLACVVGAASAQPLRLRLRNRDWDVTVGVADLAGGAGSDIGDIPPSADNWQRIQIQNTSGTWMVQVSRADTTWHSGIHIYVQRTTIVAGVTGGMTYKEIDTTDADFFWGTGNPTVNLQFMTDGGFIAAGVPPGTYTTTVTYTITDGL
jgi:hypothetical protein